MPRWNVISLFAVPVASAFTLPESATSAEAGPLKVVWASPATCPQAREALERVQGLLGADISTVLHQPLEARALVTPVDGGKFRLDLEMKQGAEGGVRTVNADTCQELTQVGALVIALTINPELLERKVGSETSADATAAAS